MGRDRKVDRLAYCRKVEAEYQADVDMAEADLKDSGLWNWLERRRELLAVAKADVADAEAALEAVPETG